MIITEIKQGENFEKALRKFKRKFDKIGILKELRYRQSYEKNSTKKRNILKKAIYKQKKQEMNIINTL
ncbi:MAG: 30S ribosomal protein S21 [Bacteroides sp.]|nr:MAG: 30S ribosomal protein S21 [Bacteroides sp.]